MLENIPQESQLRLLSLVEEIAAARSLEVIRIDEGFVFDVPVFSPAPGKKKKKGRKARRRQFVYVSADRKSMDGRDMFQVFTICAPAERRLYRNVLLLNMNIPFGAIAIYKIKERNYFVMVDTYLVEEVSRKSLENSIMTLAQCGDRVEEILMGTDVC
jgi:hypothetical protein